MANITTLGTFVEYELQNLKTQDGTPYQKDNFTMLIDSGVVEIGIGSQEYMEALLKSKNVASVGEFVELLKSEKTTLYFIDSERYIGYSFTEPFKSNNKVKMMSENVRITEIIDTPSGVTFTLEDGTVGRRSFAKKIGEQYFPNIGKRMKFIKDNVPFATNIPTYDLSELKGHGMSYIWDSVAGGHEYLKILNITPQPLAKETMTDTEVSSALDSLFGE